MLFIAGCCGRWALRYFLSSGPIFRGNLVLLMDENASSTRQSTWKDGEWGESRVREPGRVTRNPRVCEYHNPVRLFGNIAALNTDGSLTKSKTAVYGLDTRALLFQVASSRSNSRARPFRTRARSRSIAARVTSDALSHERARRTTGLAAGASTAPLASTAAGGFPYAGRRAGGAISCLQVPGDAVRPPIGAARRGTLAARE